MVVNIGHGNRNVIDAMKRQMDRVTFAYPLHFESEAGRGTGQPHGRRRCRATSPGYIFLSGGSEAVESALKLARQWAVVTGQPKPLEDHHPLPVLSWRHRRIACGDRRSCADRDLCAADPRHADHPRAHRLSRPRQSFDGTARAALCRHAGGQDPGRRAGKRARLHHGADRRGGDRRAGAAGQLFSAHPRDLRQIRHPADP